MPADLGGARDGRGGGGFGEVLGAGGVNVAFAAWVVVVGDEGEGPSGENVFAMDSLGTCGIRPRGKGRT